MEVSTEPWGKGEAPMFLRLSRHRAHRPRHSALSLLVPAVCGTLIISGPSPAHAETVEVGDAVADMVKLVGQGVEPAPDHILNDISATALVHGLRRVAVRIDHVDLKKRAGGRTQSLYVRMVTDEGVRRRLELDTRVGNWAGRTRMFDAQWRRRRCTVRHLVDYVENTIDVSFPRRCLRRPAWVRFRVYNLARSDEGSFGDDALREGEENGTGAARSVRVHRAAAG